MSATLTIQMPRGTLLTSNQRMHWATKARRTAELRLLGKHAAQVDGTRLAGPVRMDVLVRFPDNRRRDVMNLHPTVKGLVDGVVDAGLIPDDSATVLVRETYTAEMGTAPAGTVEFALTFTEASA